MHYHTKAFAKTNRQLKQNITKMNRTKEKIYGILFGQAIGDALGLAAGGMSRDMVAATYPNGVNDYADIVQDEFRSRWLRGA